MTSALPPNFHWNYANLPLEKHERGIVALVALEKDGAPRPIGTGFLLGAYGDVAVICTAAHNLTGIQHIQQPTTSHHPSALREFLPEMKPLNVSRESIRVLHAEGPLAELTAVDWAQWDERTDVAILAIRSLTGARPFGTAFKPMPDIPNVGEEIAVIGYSDIVASGGVQANGTVAIQIARKLMLFIGRVEAHHLFGHDLCKGPCLEISVPTYPGMSGSPVMPMKKPGVGSAMTPFGLVSCDIELDQSDRLDRTKRGSSFVALLRPFLQPDSAGGPDWIIMSSSNGVHAVNSQS